MKVLAALVGLCILSVAFGQAGRPAYLCEVLFNNFCPGDQSLCPSDPTLTFGANSYGFENFNLISFDSFTAGTGDIEGRAAIKNNLNLPTPGYSFGYVLKTGGVGASDASLPYSLVVGRDANWASGSLHPDGSGFPYLGAQEDMFIGGSFTGSSYLALRNTGGPCATTGCLDADFANAEAYYRLLSASWAGVTDNTISYAIQYSGITLTCTSQATDTYVITISPADFSTITYWSATGCNPQSALVVNIVGAGSQVKFAGATQNFFANARVLYNVVPSATTPSVRVEVGVNGNLLAPASNYNQPNMGVFIGQVIVANVQEVLQINLIYCAPAPTNNHNGSTTHLCPAWEATCAGLDLVFGGQTYSFRDMNAVSFGSFVADTGDIEGRLAVQNDCTFGNGYSVGYELETANGIPDRSLPYSLICGRDATWGSGSLHPDGTGIPYPGAKEDMFVGRTFTSSQQDLVDRHTGSCNGNDGCLDATFNAAKSCYTGYSNNMANTADNVQKTIEFSGLSITCNSNTATDYYVSLTAAEFASFTYTTTGNCNYQARWYINIRGNDDVTISGGSFPGVPGGIVYNVIGCGRTINIIDTELAGHLLAPCSTVNQPQGLITGKVVAGNIIASRQINRENTCPAQTTVTVPVVIASIGNNNLASFTNNFLIAGDNVDGNNVQSYNGDNTYAFDASVNGWTQHQVLYVETNTHDSRTQSVPKSGASAVILSVAFVAFVALAF